MRNHYWTCSKFADWLRGTPKLGAGTGEEWRDWRKKAKLKKFRYWLAEEGLDYLQTVFYYIPDKIYAFKYYINNRWITKTHSLTAHPSDIPRGEWRDVGGRFLPCLFNELRDFVEVELAWWHLVWEGAEERKKYNAPWWRFGWWNVRVWRCPQAGLDNLSWQMNLTNIEYTDKDSPDYGQPTMQATNAKEIYDLYMWWTVERPKRVEPMDATGWTEYCNRRRSDDEDDFFLDRKDGVDTSPMLDAMHKMEEAYEKEDEEMMIRLIKVRRALWT
jgi:hypothetical protein